ncbi:transmembrane protease, serine 11E [Turdus rufiventris]|nr:transmembrane protease, serine 11E [Turdus rufiventris]
MIKLLILSEQMFSDQFAGIALAEATAVILMDRAIRRIEPWKIAVIVLSVIVGLALIIGLITFLLCHDQDRYYNASFLITNVDYNPQYERQTTDEFRNLSEDIETMISEVFRGSFLSKRYIRSHVVSLRVRDPRRWTASFGILLRPPKQKKFVRRIIVHERYGDFLLDHEYDVAVVELASAIEFTSDVHSVCLPEASHIFPDNTSCFVTGWGALENDGYSVNQLRQAEVRIISTEICNRRQVYGGAITPGMLCAGYLEGQVDACQGDSGGPLVHANSRGIWYLVGIVSWGDECGKPNKPGVYTRVTYYRNWIHSKTGI